MNIYIDESGSIDRHLISGNYFLIALIHVLEPDKLAKAFKRFVSSNYLRLQELDGDKFNIRTGKTIKSGGKMFKNGKFRELKGVQFDHEMKKMFVHYFARGNYFELYYIRIDNRLLFPWLFDHTARIFNYSLCRSLEYLIKNGFLPDEHFHLQLDERNERKEARFFLENYLNTELNTGGITCNNFTASYFDSANNRFIQIADIFANLLYSQEQTGQYEKELTFLKDAGILKYIYDFPHSEAHQHSL